MGSSIVHGDVGGETALVEGKVCDPGGSPIAGATLDIWETAPNGLYEQQDPDQPDMNLRGRFLTAADGRYAFKCVRPVKYPVPFDGPAGELLQHMGRHPYRPGHLHFFVSAPGHRPLITQIFDRSSEHLDSDSVFAVKQELIVDFVPAPAGSDVDYRVEFDLFLAPL
jgi:catechol 1,2-dioxygenase